MAKKTLQTRKAKLKSSATGSLEIHGGRAGVKRDSLESNEDRVRRGNRVCVVSPAAQALLSGGRIEQIEQIHWQM